MLAIAAALGVAVVAWTDAIGSDAPNGSADAGRDGLRMRALAGQREAVIEVFQQRMAAEAGPADRAATMETLFWAERAWAVDDHATRLRLGEFIDRHCDDPRVSWHWLCDPGE